jgi:hypothetical protein
VETQRLGTIGRSGIALLALFALLVCTSLATSGCDGLLDGGARGSTEDVRSIDACRVASVTASDSRQASPPVHAVDGNLATRWAAPGPSASITLDLGASMQIDRVTIGWYRGESRSSSFAVSVGTTQSALTEVLRATSSGIAVERETHPLPAGTTARYVRMTVLETDGPWIAVSELEARGACAGLATADAGTTTSYRDAATLPGDAGSTSTGAPTPAPTPTPTPSAAPWAVRAGHPRIFVGATELAAARARITAPDFAAAWSALSGYASRRTESAATLAADRWQVERHVQALAGACLLAGDPALCTRAIDVTLAIAAIPHDTEDDIAGRTRIIAMALGYDWLFSRLTSAQRTTVRTSILARVDHELGRAGVMAPTTYLGGHARRAHHAALTGLLAVYDEAPTRHAQIDTLRAQFADGWNPMQGYAAVGGGYQMGWDYGLSYLDPAFSEVWAHATTTDELSAPWQLEVPAFVQYADRGNGRFPRIGDVFSGSTPDVRMIALRAAVRGGDRRALALYDASLARSSGADRIFELLWGRGGITPLSPEGMPPGLCVENAGYLIARDRWDASSTVLVLKASSFQSINHHHRDDNHIDLSYRGVSMLVRAGTYAGGGYGSDHWRNFYTRSIAHNTLVVYDPAERFVQYGSARANDGGQRLPNIEPTRVGDIAEGGAYHVGGIEGCTIGDEHAYARGDASRAYSSDKLTRFVRHVVQLRAAHASAPPSTVVVDEVATPRLDLRRALLWHLPSSPTVEAGHVSATQGTTARLHLYPLAPASSVTVVDDRTWRLYDGTVHSPTTGAQTGIDETSHRIEVSPTTARARPALLTEAVGVAGASVGREVAAVVVGGERTDVAYRARCGATTMTHRIFGLPDRDYAVTVGTLTTDAHSVDGVLVTARTCDGASAVVRVAAR